jgi:hypothetical protein
MFAEWHARRHVPLARLLPAPRQEAQLPPSGARYSAPEEEAV